MPFKYAFQIQLVNHYATAGSQGRSWLTEGKLANASISERFEAHLGVMCQDAKPHSGTSRWTRYWWGWVRAGGGGY